MPQASRRARSATRSSRPARNEGFARKQRGNSASGPNLARERDRSLDAALDAAAAAEPTDTPTTFSGTGLPERLVSVLNRRGMTVPFAIQARTLTDALAGRDILGRAQTGSGKTLAFGLPMLARLSTSTAQRPPGVPGGLVLVPTRELAQQVTNALRPLGRALRLDLLEVYGGASMRKQVLGLRSGADLVVATPGRLIDLIEQGECDLGQVEISVLDEADYMADLGFMPAVTRLLDLTPDGAQRMLFSATLDRGVGALVERYLNDPAFHAVAPAAAPVESVDHRVFVLSPDTKVAVAAEIAGRPGRTMFFVRTKHGADRLAKQLRKEGVHAAPIHGDLKQGARRRALAGFAAGAPRVLIATDVAARGIHVDDVDLVVHFDPAGDHKDYLHRSGRTARAGATGTVVSLIHPNQRRDVARMHQSARVAAVSVDVEPGHGAVRDVATSGTPIVVRPVEAERGDRGDRGGRRNSRRGSNRPAGSARGSAADERSSSERSTGNGSRGYRSNGGRPTQGRRERFEGGAPNDGRSRGGEPGQNGQRRNGERRNGEAHNGEGRKVDGRNGEARTGDEQQGPRRVKKPRQRQSERALSG